MVKVEVYIAPDCEEELIRALRGAGAPEFTVTDTRSGDRAPNGLAVGPGFLLKFETLVHEDVAAAVGAAIGNVAPASPVVRTPVVGVVHIRTGEYQVFRDKEAE